MAPDETRGSSRSEAETARSRNTARPSPAPGEAPVPTPAEVASALGVPAATLVAELGTAAATVDLVALEREGPRWLLEARAEEAMRQAALSVLRAGTSDSPLSGNSPDRAPRSAPDHPRTAKASHPSATSAAQPPVGAAGSRAHGGPSGAPQQAGLGDDEVAALLGLPVEAVAAFTPRRGWTSEEVASLVRNPPAWTESPAAARQAGRELTRKAAARDYRRQAAATAKARTKDQARARWAEILEIDEALIPVEWTKQPTPSAVASFRARPPRWAREFL